MTHGNESAVMAIRRMGNSVTVNCNLKAARADNRWVSLTRRIEKIYARLAFV
jgi:hypothetical protein